MDDNRLHEYRLKQLEDNIFTLREELRIYKNEQSKRDRNQMVAGISFLGTLVLSLVALLYNNLVK